MIESLATLLKNGANPALRYQNSSNLLRDLAQAITQCFEDEADLVEHLPRLTTLIMNHDYRLVAEYLAARKNHNKAALSIFHQMIAEKIPITINKQRYQLAHARFADTIPFPERANVSFTYQLEDVFSSRNQQLVIYLHDEQYRALLTTLTEAVGAMLGKFIEQQYDISGLNAVVRQGLVRTWYLPDGTAVVSKRENPQKKGCFRREQRNYDTLLDRFGKQATMLPNLDNPDDNITIRIARPFAVIYDGYSGRHYALSAYEDGVPLEDVLLTERDSNVRNRFLAHYRLLLDRLYECGILWGDMSLRNILIKQQGHTVTYTLVDFEKTYIFDAPISLAQRMEHCRGQICVEELGVLCPQEEVLACFKGYFDPSAWDLESKAALPFPPRPEIADILRGRGVLNVTLGAYNTIDRAIMGVRIPDTDPQTKARRFPGHLGFKVEHYLSCAGYAEASDYDRKTTEVLIAAKQQGCFDDVVDLLADATNMLESAFLKAEFVGMLQGGFSGNVMPPQQEIENLTQILEVFYQVRQHRGAYQRLVAQWQAGVQIGLP